MSKEKTGGAIERGADFFKRLNYVLGGLALAGAIILPPPASEYLLLFAGLQFAEGAVWKYIQNKRAAKSKTPKLQPA